jgi:hypothetical protein
MRRSVAPWAIMRAWMTFCVVVCVLSRQTYPNEPAMAAAREAGAGSRYGQHSSEQEQQTERSLLRTCPSDTEDSGPVVPA